MSQKQDELESAIDFIMGGKKSKMMISDKAANPDKVAKFDIRKGKTMEERVGHLQVLAHILYFQMLSFL